MARSLLERLQLLPGLAVLLVGLMLILLISWLDWMTGPKVALNVFYLLPVMLVAWATASAAFGLVAALVTFLVGPVEAALDGFHFYSLPVAVWNAAVRTAVFCIVLVLLAKLRRLIIRLRDDSFTDELTGIPNRRAFVSVAAREIERSRRYNHQLSLAYLDIDGFKAINDRRGHAVGDRLLIALAGAAHATARTVDTVARLGGDEFVVLMPETGEEAALPLADRLREVCSQAAGAGEERVTCSVGVVTYEQPPADVRVLMSSADALMYEAKAAGGDEVRQASVIRA